VIETDNVQVASLAAEHLLDRGFRRFAYCGFRGLRYSQQRQEAFVARVAAAGYPVSVFAPRLGDRKDALKLAEQRGQAGQCDLMAWLAELPKPIGLMACSDLRGQQVLNACRESGIEVPDQIAVIGVDDDEIVCRLSDPPLSSVAPDTQRIGFEAGLLLDRLMHGEASPPEPLLVPPQRIVTRQSTDVLAIDDQDVARAIHFIRQHACNGITINDVLKNVPMTRMTLKRRFMRVLGHSAKTEIMRVQVERVKQLLAETDLSQAKIAILAGFTHAEYLSAAFKQRTGQTPRQYRAASRGFGDVH
jgi:LacI family transcriptional regulator